MIRIILVMAGIALVAGCVSLEKQSKPQTMPEIHPGILQGYLPAEVAPDSLALIPPPPMEDSTAPALDKDVSLQNLALQGTARWGLAAQDTELKFPQVAGTFSCALNAPITEQETPHLYMLLRRTLAEGGLSTYTAKNHYIRTRPFVMNNAPTCTPEDEEGLMNDVPILPEIQRSDGHGHSSLPRFLPNSQMPSSPELGPLDRAGRSVMFIGKAM